MNCPSCNSSLESNARFCGVCGYRLSPGQQGRSASGPAGPAAAPARPGSNADPARAPAAQPVRSQVATPAAGAPRAQPKPNAVTPKSSPRIKPKNLGDELYLGQTLNNRFKVESKIGEGGFGAVYRGTQLATNRKVALKLLHPEMTKDENLVARFRREGMVLCNLRDAHTITTYDFDQTPDGTLYIAMELLEGKSLHQIFHEEAPLEWKRVFKILTEMCSSLAEAHEQGIVHRDLKPENIYLEHRPGNSEFVKILDFGIAKVMRGDAIDPQSPQLTATGQTLGTLEYMSPEQLMGKQLDGRSDVYALGVVAYEMITGRLPFPDAKGPAGLITAQLKQTPMPPSQALPKAKLPDAADRTILKCLEKDKNNRYADVSALAEALQDVVLHAEVLPPIVPVGAMPGKRQAPPELLETRRGENPSNLSPPPMPMQMPGPSRGSSPMIPNGQQMPMPMQQAMQQPTPLYNQVTNQPMQPPMMPMSQMDSSPNHGPPQSYAPQYPMQQMQSAPPLQITHQIGGSSKKWIWWVVGLLAFGAAAGAVLAILLKRGV